MIDTVLKSERDILQQLGRPLPDKSYADSYYDKVEDNLWNRTLPQGHHFDEYNNGNGGELNNKGNRPAKMRSIRSSSAMTYNMLGAESICLTRPLLDLQAGSYRIVYEKKLYTSRNRPSQANLDAFLYDEEKQNAIFCEMKMLEWFTKNTPQGQGLKTTYEAAENYQYNFGKEENPFLRAIKLLKAQMPAQGFFDYFDAWQLFKHTLGIYNALVNKTDKKDASLKLKSTLRPIKKAVLLNVVFEPKADIFIGAEREEYQALLAEEHSGFAVFSKAMHEGGVIEAFAADCGVDFDLNYINVRDFLTMFDLDKERDEYLDRYRI